PHTSTSSIKAMFRRALLSIPRLAAPAAVTLTTTTPPTLLRQIPPTSRMSVAACRRYSTERGKEDGDKAAEQPTKPAEATTTTNGTTASNESETLAEALKKYNAELEKKAQEAAELKVSPQLTPSTTSEFD